MRNYFRLRKVSRVDFYLLSVSYLNFLFWFIFGYIFLHREFENHEIVFPMLVLMLNTVVAISVLFLGFLMWEGEKNSLYYLMMLPGILIPGVEFNIVYPVFGEIFYDLSG